MAFRGVLAEDQNSITFEREDGGTYKALRSPAAEELAAGLYAKPANDAPQRVTQSQGTAGLDLSPLVAERSPDIPMKIVGPAPAAPKPAAPPAAPNARNAAAWVKQQQQTLGPSVFDPQAGGPRLVSERELQAAQQPAAAPTPTPAPKVPGVPAPVPQLTEQQAADAKAAQMYGEASRPQYSPGSPAVTEADLKKRGGVNIGGQAYVVPQKGSIKTEDIKPEVPAELRSAMLGSVDEQQKVALEQRDAMERQRQMEEAEVERRASVIGDEMRANEQAIAEQRARRADWERRLAVADQEVADFKMDPDRIFKQRGPLATVAAVIGMALGAGSQALGGGPNNAMQIVQTQIDRDIESQRQEYLLKKGTSDTLVARLVQTLGDLDSATLKAKELQLQATQSYGDQLAMATKREDIQLAWQKERAAIEVQRNNLNLALLDRAGTASVAGAGKVEGPRAATAGGWVRPTEAQIAKRLELKLKIDDTLAKLAGRPTSETRQKMAEHMAEAEATGVKSEVVNKYAMFKLDAQHLQAALESAENLIKPHLDERGEVKNDIPGVGAGKLWPMAAGSKEHQQQKAAANRVLAAYVRMISGAQATEAEAVRLTKAILGDTDYSYVQGLKFMRSQFNMRNQSIDALYQGTGATEQAARGAAELDRAAEAAAAHRASGNAGIGDTAVNEIINQFQSSFSDIASGVEVQP